MATMNFSVRDDVKEDFNKAFKGENKSAVLTRLMRRAVNEHERQKQRMAVVSAILDLRAKNIAVSNDEIREARTTGRP